MPTRRLTSALLLIADRLEFGDCFEILWPTCSPLDLNQALQSEASAFGAEDADHVTIWQQHFVGASAHDLPEEVDGAGVRGERKVEPAPKRLEIPSERKPRWRATEVRFESV